VRLLSVVCPTQTLFYQTSITHLSPPALSHVLNTLCVPHLLPLLHIPLHPSVTPITPAFIRPLKSPGEVDVKISCVTTRKKLFYPDAVRKVMIFGGGSVWLQKTAVSAKKGILIVLLIAGGIVIGVFLSRKTPSNQPQVALGGSADSQATSTSSSSTGP